MLLTPRSVVDQFAQLDDAEGIQIPRRLTASAIGECFQALNGLFADKTAFKIRMDERSRLLVESIDWAVATRYAMEARKANLQGYAELVTGSMSDTINRGVANCPVRPWDVYTAAECSVNFPSIAVLLTMHRECTPLQPPPRHPWTSLDDNGAPSAVPTITVAKPIEEPLNSYLIRMPHIQVEDNLVTIPWWPIEKLPSKDALVALPVNFVIEPEFLNTFLSGTAPRAHILLQRLKAFIKRVHLQAVVEFPCPHVTAGKCTRVHESQDRLACADRYHFNQIFNKVTDFRYGDCSYLSGCYNFETCAFVHYKRVNAVKPKTFAEMIKLPPALELAVTSKYGGESGTFEEAIQTIAAEVKDGLEYPAQWINADLRDSISG